MSKLSYEQKLRVIKYVNDGVANVDIAKIFNVVPSSISKIKKEMKTRPQPIWMTK